jgi:hypothetical protein
MEYGAGATVKAVPPDKGVLPTGCRQQLFPGLALLVGATGPLFLIGAVEAALFGNGALAVESGFPLLATSLVEGQFLGLLLFRLLHQVLASRVFRFLKTVDPPLQFFRLLVERCTLVSQRLRDVRLHAILLIERRREIKSIRMRAGAAI